MTFRNTGDATVDISFDLMLLLLIPEMDSHDNAHYSDNI